MIVSAPLCEYPALFPLVREIRIMESENADNSLAHFSFYADGLPGIMFQQGEGEMLLNGGEKKLSRLYLYGQTVKPIEIAVAGSFRIIVFFLDPPVVRALCGVDAHELTDTCVDMEMLPFNNTRSLIDQLQETPDAESQISLLTGFLRRLMRNHLNREEQDVRFALTHIMASKGQTPLPVLREKLHLTERTFERKFLRYVGVSPRLYTRICRFHAAMKQLESGKFSKLTGVAFENGFSDQSHFIRDFREFTGTTPREYLATFMQLHECVR